MFRDGGWEAARGAILGLLEPSFARLAAEPDGAGCNVNAKGELQEHIQSEGGETPR